MATSGSFSTNAFTASSGGTRTLAFDWKRDGYSVENNNTTISYNLKGSGSYTGWVNVRNIKLTIDGTVVYNVAGPIKVYQGTVLKSGKITIPHNSLGEKSLKVSLECDIYYSNGNQTGSGTWTLDKIPRASTITAPDGYIGSKTAITIKSASKNFRHKLSWAITGLSGKITASVTDKTTVEFEIPTSIYAKIPNDKKVKVTVTCETYNYGDYDTPIGNPTTCTFNALVNEQESKPTITFDSILDTNEATKDRTNNPEIIVTNLSNVKVIGLTAKGNNSATIKSLVVKCGNAIANITSEFEDREINFVTAQSGTITFVATDSRGYTTEVIHKAETYDYYLPRMTIEAKRIAPTSDNVKVEYSGYWYGQFKNGLSVDYRYLKDDNTYSDWINILQRDENKNNTLTQGAAAIANLVFQGAVEALDTFDTNKKFDYTKTHTLEFRVKDSFYTQKYPIIVPRGVPVFDWGEDDFNFNVPVTFQAAVNFNQPATVDDEPTADFVVEQGTKGVFDSQTNSNVTWYYRKWNSGIAECWATRNTGNMTPNIKWTNSYYADAPAAISYPFEFVESPVENASVMGISINIWKGCVTANTKSQTARYYILRDNALNTPYNIWFQYHIIGRWK